MIKLLPIIGIAVYFVLSSFAQNKLAVVEELPEEHYVIQNIDSGPLWLWPPT